MTSSAHAKSRSLLLLQSSQLMAGSIALAAALLLAGVLLLLQQAMRHAHELAYSNARDINSKIALSDEMRIRSLLASLDKVLLIVRKDFEVKPRLKQEDLKQRLVDLKVDAELDPRISLVDAQGDVAFSSDIGSTQHPLTINVADRSYFLAQKAAPSDQLQVAIPVQSRTSHLWVVPLTRRISRPDGSFGGMVVMTVDPSLFTQPFETSSQGANAARALIGLDGFTRLRLNGDRVVYGGDSRSSRLFEELKRAKIGTYTAQATSDAVVRTVSYRVIEPYSLVILAGSSVDSIEAAYAEKVGAYQLAAALFSVLIVLLSGLLMRGMSRQRTLFQSQQSFQQLIELVPQLVFSLDVQGHIVWVNRRTVAYMGSIAPSFDWVLAAVHPEDQLRLQEFTHAALQGQAPSACCEYRARRFDGAYLWFSAQITEVTDRDGRPASYLQTGTDIHDNKMSQERVRVVHKLESIGQFTSGMAHDFNNLLAIMVGNLDLLAQQITSKRESEWLGIALGAAHRGVTLVKSLLALASRQALLPVTLELSVLLERISPLLRHALGQRVSFEIRQAAFGLCVQADESAMEAALLNLIVNARDAMPNGGRMTLLVSAAHGMVHLLFKDSGTGMSEAVRKRATEPFFTTKERGSATGLGLSMVAGFVKQSGGTMEIQSTEGIGTTIALHLPLVLAAAPAAALPQDIAPAAGAQKKHLLVVDDEPEIAALIDSWAKADGHRVLVAHSAQEARAMLAVKHFDVLLTDITMPGETDGLGLAEQASADYPLMKIVLMSGYPMRAATARATVHWQLLVKPFRKSDFDAALVRGFIDSGHAALEQMEQ